MCSARTFADEEFEQRRARLRAVMAHRQLPVLVVTAPEDVYYLSGLHNQGHFVFTALIVHARPGPPILVAREMEAPTAAAQAPDCRFAGYHDDEDPAGVICQALGHLGRDERRVGYQPRSLSLPVAVWQAIDSGLGSPDWVDCARLMAEVQSLRSAREINCLRQAAGISDIGVRAGIAAAAGGPTGAQLVGAVQDAMFAAGSDYPGFVPLVRPIGQIRQEHVAWTDDQIGPDDTLFFELSAAVARYHAPLARTVRPRHTTAPPAAELATAGLAAIVAGLRPGRTAAEVHHAWKTTVEAGLGHSYRRHHCGYSVGIGFPPSWMAGRVDSLRPGNDTVLRAGMSFHVQSWILDESLGRYAISDTALVTPAGGELLTTTPHDPTRPVAPTNVNSHQP